MMKLRGVRELKHVDWATFVCQNENCRIGFQIEGINAIGSLKTKIKCPLCYSSNVKSLEKIIEEEKMKIRRVWKYPIPPFGDLDTEDCFTVKMPQFSQILTVQVQYGKPCIWALVNPASPLTDRRFRVAGTGHDLVHDFELMQYVGTFQLQDGKFIGHVFEVD